MSISVTAHTVWEIYLCATIYMMTLNVILQSWKECWIALLTFMKWARKHLYHLKSMTNSTPHSLKWFLICNSTWKVITLKNTKRDYYIEDTLIKTIPNMEEDKRALSMFHMNIRSLPKHFDELQQYLNVLKYDFSVIGISETWLGENNADI